MNCDDHAKNFAFLMDKQGKWRLSPAFDVTFAYNSKNIWLKEHLMGIDGKFADVTIQDLLRFAERHNVPYAQKAITESKRAIAMWPDFAQQTGVSKKATDEISELLFSR